MKTIHVAAAIIIRDGEILAAQRGYGEFKQAVAEAVIATLRPIQEEYARLLADKGYLDGVLAEGAARADAIARRTLAKVYKKIGFLQL